LRAALRQRGILPLVSYGQKRGPQPGVQAAHERKPKRYGQQRWKGERSFAWINRFRRLARFLERSQKSYRAFVRVFFLNHYLDRLFYGSSEF